MIGEVAWVVVTWKHGGAHEQTVSTVEQSARLAYARALPGALASGGHAVLLRDAATGAALEGDSRMDAGKPQGVAEAIADGNWDAFDVVSRDGAEQTQLREYTALVTGVAVPTERRVAGFHDRARQVLAVLPGNHPVSPSPVEWPGLDRGPRVYAVQVLALDVADAARKAAVRDLAASAADKATRSEALRHRRLRGHITSPVTRRTDGAHFDFTSLLGDTYAVDVPLGVEPDESLAHGDLIDVEGLLPEGEAARDLAATYVAYLPGDDGSMPDKPSARLARGWPAFPDGPRRA